MIFDNVQTAPPDAILGLTEAFNADTNPKKINLSVGVYQDADGTTPILQTVREAERRLLESEKSKSYRPIPGDAAYNRAVQALMFDDPALTDSSRMVSAHTPGGTGALRVAGDLLCRIHGQVTVHVSDPTWANHDAVFRAAGLATATYPYYNASAFDLDFEAMMKGIEQVPAGDVIVLHACCHNPTGADPTAEQWERIATTLAQRRIVPLVDFAYQGLAEGLEPDALGVRALARHVPEMFIASSFSKNFGLYSERTGALSILAATPAAAEAVFSQLKTVIRANYSNPPAHGGSIVTTILGDAALRKQWEQEVAQMRDRINGIRATFARALDERGVKLSPDGNGFITRQKGMFSFSGLSREQVERLRKEDSIYIVGSGRINVAGMNQANVPLVCDAIRKVTGA